MKTHFTADDHLAHENILAITDRDLHFSSVEEHDEGMLEGINSTVGENDRLFMQGDFAWRAGESFIKRIRCKNLHLIFGNHDRASFGKLFKSVEDTAIVKIQGHKVFLSHYPHAYWPSSHYGSLHLYGHVHAEREKTLDIAFPGRRSMDAGLDNAKLLLGQYRPFSEDEVIGILMARPGHDLIEWYDQQRAARRDNRLVKGKGCTPPLGRPYASDEVPRLITYESVVNPEQFHKYRKALEEIARPLDCGCNPCKGQCRDAAALEIELEARIDIARDAIKVKTAAEVAKNLADVFRRRGQYDTGSK